MTTSRKHALIAVLASLAGTLGCGGGTNLQYFHVTLGQGSAQTGSDCPGLGSELNEYQGIDGTGTWVIYPGPNNQFLLEGALGDDLMIGTQSGSGYSFTGTETKQQTVASVATLGMTTSQSVISKVTLTLTMSGPGFTGTSALETACTSGDGQSCVGISNDGKDSDCNSSSSIAGTQITGVLETAGIGPTAPTAP